ncbi:MAG: hypothetical protein CL569_20490 [Alphaproteobacteria bacterium]|nr:hypothetical protein [Alphaproteobacteria bacterium]
MTTSSEAKVVVHGGLEKAASTFLQERIFPNVPNYDYVPDMRQSLIALGTTHWSQLNPTVLSDFAWLTESRTILSAEGLVCVERAYDGAYTNRSNLTIANLSHLLKDAVHLLIVLRRQDTAIDSMIRYKQRYLADPKSFLVDFPFKRTPVSTVWDYRSLTSRLLQSYNYHHHLIPAFDLLGPDRVTLLTHEELVEKPNVFFARLGKVLDTDIHSLVAESEKKVNARSAKYSDLPEQYVPMPHVVRRLNNLSGNRVEKLLPSRESGLTEKMKREIVDIFRDSNRQLSDLFKLDLDEYGYF